MPDTYILYASHIAAMAPGTNLGAATPVQIGGLPEPPERGTKPEPSKITSQSRMRARVRRVAVRHGQKTRCGDDSVPMKDTMSHKMIHDAAAYIRGLAQMRDRNAEWAERAVREAVSLSATEALNLKVIDYVAADVPDLLKQVNGRHITIQGQDLSWIRLQPR